LPGLKESFKARIDTGATTSSISAVDIVPFERGGQDWVKFRIEHDNIRSEELSLPVERWVRIRQSSAEEAQRRAVVVAWIQIGDLKEQTEFTLTDRTHLTYPLLLGRSFFKDVAVVDVSRHYIQPKHPSPKK
ncbi:ATP-dependent zinc protease, partial [Vibrio parahaemolyticus]|nr:ATP-dependent zinc protease [Vibrio parahaemolyticus]